MKTVQVTQVENFQAMEVEIHSEFERPLKVKHIKNVDLKKMTCEIEYYWQHDRADKFKETFKLKIK